MVPDPRPVNAYIRRPSGRRRRGAVRLDLTVAGAAFRPSFVSGTTLSDSSCDFPESVAGRDSGCQLRRRLVQYIPAPVAEGSQTRGGDGVCRGRRIRNGRSCRSIAQPLAMGTDWAISLADACAAVGRDLSWRRFRRRGRSRERVRFRPCGWRPGGCSPASGIASDHRDGGRRCRFSRTLRISGKIAAVHAFSACIKHVWPSSAEGHSDSRFTEVDEDRHS